MLANTTLKVYPDFFRFTDYEYSLKYGYTRDYDIARTQKATTRQDSVNRAKSRLFDLISCNFKQGDIFLTPTYNYFITDRKKAVYDLKLFIKRLEYKLNKKIKYVAVIEPQKSGRLHFHILLPSGTVDKSTAETVWGLGFVKLKALYGDRYASYIAKYLGKENLRSASEKHYFCSKNLNKPQKLYGELADAFRVFLYSYTSGIISQFETLTKYLGKIIITTMSTPCVVDYPAKIVDFMAEHYAPGG